MMRKESVKTEQWKSPSLSGRERLKRGGAKPSMGPKQKSNVSVTGASEDKEEEKADSISRNND